MKTLLTSLEHAGSQFLLHANATREERIALELHLYALKAAGHAIAADEVMAAGEYKGDIRVIHFLSCQHASCKRKTI